MTSKAFALADHQIAHIYIADPALQPKVREIVEQLPGIERVYDYSNKSEAGLDHARSGELVAIADT